MKRGSGKSTTLPAPVGKAAVATEGVVAA